MKTWNECVSEAKVLVRNIKTDRLKIARLAILASELPGSNMTISRFGKDIGVSPQTLSKWVDSYRAYRLRHPVKEPEAQDYKGASKAAAEAKEAKKAAAGPKTAPSAGRPVIHISIKTASFLRDVNNLKDRLKVKGEAKAIEQKVRNELIIKLKEIVSILEKA